MKVNILWNIRKFFSPNDVPESACLYESGDGQHLICTSALHQPEEEKGVALLAYTPRMESHGFVYKHT